MTQSLTDEYYAALDRGELMLQHCNGCNANIMYPKYVCPFCGSRDLGWIRSSGRGILHSFTVQRVGAPGGFEADLPYALGVVKLDDGVQLLGRLRPDSSGGWDGYACDAPVRFDPTRDQSRHIAWFEGA